MALAVTSDGRRYAAPGFNHEAHDRWVLAGNCPVISVAKSWCDKKAGHDGRHGSPLVLPPGPGEVPGGALLPGKPEPGMRPSPVRYVEWDW
jgi:hypothetical protein